MKLILTIVSLALIALFNSCTESEDGRIKDIELCISEQPIAQQTDSNYVEFYKNRARFECSDYDHVSYEFVGLNQFCFRTSIYLEVKNGIVIDSSIADQPFPDILCEDITKFVHFSTIEELYERIELAVDQSVPLDSFFFTRRQSPKFIADRIRIEYDTISGIPIKGYIDYNFGWADEEFGWEINNFTEL